MDKIPKIGLPIIFIVVFGVILVLKSAITIDAGEAGVLWKRFDGGVVVNEPPLEELSLIHI